MLICNNSEGFPSMFFGEIKTFVSTCLHLTIRKKYTYFYIGVYRDQMIISVAVQCI